MRGDHAVILVADSTRANISQHMADTACQALRAHRTRWLNPQIAVEFHIDETDDRHISALKEECRDLQIDISIMPLANRRKQMLVADMDSTIIEQECIDELARAAGVGDEIAEITTRAMNGEIEFEAATRMRVGRIAGLNSDSVDHILNERIHLTPGAAELVGTMRAHGAYCVLVSGGYTLFTQRVATWLGFHENHANRLIIEDGKIAGRVAMPLLGKNAKREIMLSLMNTHKITKNEVLAVGDGSNDLAMLSAAGLGVAFRAKPIVMLQTTHHVVHGDLSSLLYLQGYKAAEFQTRSSND